MAVARLLLTRYPTAMMASRLYAGDRTGAFLTNYREILGSCRLFIWEQGAGLDCLADRTAPAFDRVGRVDETTDRRREPKERDHLCPGPALSLRHSGITLPHRGLGKDFEGAFGLNRVRSLVNGLRPRSRCEMNAVEERMRCTMQVWCSVRRKTTSSASGMPLRPSVTAIRMSFTPRVFRLLNTLAPKLAPSFSAIHMPGTSRLLPLAMPRAM